MSRFEGPQGIVTNGLVLNLDAGDPDSYTRSQPPYVEVLVVAGGGGGGQDGAGGGGAGGLIYNSAYQLTSAAAVTVTVGGGGAGTLANPGQASDGSNSVFGSLTAVGGGGGGSKTTNGRSGGSGGGAGHNAAGASSNIGGDGTAGQGFRGGDNIAQSGGGGGGAGQPGFYGSNPVPGNGGNGLAFTISGTSTYYAGGGGGGGYVSPVTSSGGLGGGGNGGGYLSNGAPSAVGQNGTANTGGGGGSNGNAGNSTVTGTGGSGIVIVRYPGLPAATGGTITYLNGYTIHTFTSSGTFTPYPWNDLTGIAGNSTLYNGVGFVPNLWGGVLQFDSTDDYSRITNPNVTLGTNPRTLIGWFRATSSVYGCIFGFGNAPSGTPTYGSMELWNYANPLSMHYAGGSISSGLSLDTNLNKWLMAVLKFDGTTASIQIIDNGTSYSNSANVPLNTYTANFSVNKSAYANEGGGLAGYWSTVLLYNRALSATEITQNYNATKARFGL